MIIRGNSGSSNRNIFTGQTTGRPQQSSSSTNRNIFTGQETTTNEQQRGLERIARIDREAAALWNQGKKAEAQQYRIDNNLWPVDIKWYNPARHDFAGGTVRYSGLDFRGNEISAGNMQQFLLDYSQVQKALNKVNSGQGELYATLQPLWDQGIANFQVKVNNDTRGWDVYLPGIANGLTSQLLDNIIAQAPQLKTNPDLIPQVIQQSPQFVSEAWNWVNGNTQAAMSKEASKDKGGFGVVAEGLGQVAQFAGLASGLHGLTAGLGAITSGAGLGGAFNAGMNAAGSIANIGDVVGGIVGNPAIGNLANVGVGGITGGYNGGVPGAVIGAGGAAIGAGIDYAGGVGEFVRNPLEALGGAFDVVGGAGTNVTGLLNDMGDVAQIGPGSLAANTPTPGLNLGGPTVMSTDLPSGIANEVVTVTASAPGATSSFGWLPSTLAAIGVPLGSQLLVNESGNLTGWRPPDGGPIGLVIGAGTPPDFVNGQPTGNPVGGTGQGGVAETGGGTGGQAQAGGGTGGTSVIGGAATGGLLTPGTGTATIGSGTTGAGVGGTGGDLAGIGGSATGGIAQGGTGAGTSPTSGGQGTPTTTGGTTAGTGLLDQTITGGTMGGTATGSGAATQEPTPVQVGSQQWLNQLLATQATTSPMLPVNPVNSWANSGMGQVQDFVSAQTPSTPETGSQEWLNAILAGAGLGAAGVGLAGLGGSSPVNGWAFSGTGTPQDFVTPGGGIGNGAGLGGGSGLGDGTGLGGGLGDGTGLGGGLGDGTGLGTGTGEGTGLGAGIGAGLGLLADAAPIVDQAVQATNNPLDFGLPDLSMLTGGTAGGLGEATGSGIYGGKMGGFEGKYPKTPKKKKRGITVQIAGARRNA